MLYLAVLLNIAVGLGPYAIDESSLISIYYLNPRTKVVHRKDDPPCS